jgi:hypothetical protein
VPTSSLVTSDWISGANPPSDCRAVFGGGIERLRGAPSVMHGMSSLVIVLSMS